MAEIVNMNYIDWDNPLLEWYPMIQDLIRLGHLQGGTVNGFVFLTTPYISTYSKGNTWDEALLGLFPQIKSEFEELKSERA